MAIGYVRVELIVEIVNEPSRVNFIIENHFPCGVCYILEFKSQVNPIDNGSLHLQVDIVQSGRLAFGHICKR